MEKKKRVKWKTTIPFSGKRPTEGDSLIGQFFYFLSICTEESHGCCYFFSTCLDEAILVRMIGMDAGVPRFESWLCYLWVHNLVSAIQLLSLSFFVSKIEDVDTNVGCSCGD